MNDLALLNLGVLGVDGVGEHGLEGLSIQHYFLVDVGLGVL